MGRNSNCNTPRNNERGCPQTVRDKPETVQSSALDALLLVLLVGRKATHISIIECVTYQIIRIP